MLIAYCYFYLKDILSLRNCRFAGLGAGLAWGTVQESVKRLAYGTPTLQGNQSALSPYLSEKNAERLALALCRMRGAALKIGQMLSIQDESLVPPPVMWYIFFNAYACSLIGMQKPHLKWECVFYPHLIFMKITLNCKLNEDRFTITSSLLREDHFGGVLSNRYGVLEYLCCSRRGMGISKWDC